MYPITEPHQSGHLAVSDIHEIYWEVSGHPQGKPVVFLHGGPGAGAPPVCRGFFNPEKYRIVLFDQRGCGRSRPYGCVDDNTTWDLVADIERLREMLGIERWLVFGGSWGSTLALAYAQSHPERVSWLVLRCLFMCRTEELDWLYQSGASWILPDYWQRHFLPPIPPEERDNLIAAYHRRLFADGFSAAEREAAAVGWSSWEESTSFLRPDEAAISLFGQPASAVAFARICTHYFVHHGWLSGDKALLANVERIRHIPAVLIQGRYDICTPPHSTWALKQAWPELEFHWTLAGHSAFEAETSERLLAATDRFAG